MSIIPLNSIQSRFILSINRLNPLQENPMKAATFGAHVGKTYKEIDHALNFLPALPRKLSVSALMLLALPVIGIAFFLFVRVPAPLPKTAEPEVKQVNNNEHSEEDYSVVDDIFVDVKHVDGFGSQWDPDNPKYIGGKRIVNWVKVFK